MMNTQKSSSSRQVHCLNRLGLGVATIVLGAGVFLSVTSLSYGVENELVELNKVSNPSFDRNYSSNKRDWTVKAGGNSLIETDESNQNAYGRIKKGTNDEFVLQKIPTTVGKTYVAKAKVKVAADSSPEGLFFTAKSVQANGNQGPVLNQLEAKEITDGWVDLSFEFEATSVESMVGIVKWAETAGNVTSSEISLDDISVTEKETYEILWEDEFTGDTLDQGVWGYELGSIRGNEQQHYSSSKDNVFLREDNLVLKVTDRPEADQYVNPRPSSGGREVIYNSGSVRTHGKKEFLYGRIEVNAKLPKGKGAFPAFWTLGSDFVLDGDINREQGYGWPSTGELDIMEIIGAPTDEREGEEVAEGDQSNRISYGTPHFYYVNGDGDKDGSYSPYPLGGNLTINDDFYDDYHVFGMNWSPDKIEWYVDGVVYNTMSLTGDARLEAAAANFQRPQYIQFNLATGGNWAKNAGTHLAEDNTEFIIDSVTWSQNAEQKAAASSYYQDHPTFTGIQDVTMTQGEIPDLVKDVTTDKENYLVDFSVDNEYMYENTGGNTNVDLKSSGIADKAQLAKLTPGVYNIHYSAVPEGVSLVGNVTPTEKIGRETALLTVLPQAGLIGQAGAKLSTVSLPTGWEWEDETELIGSGDAHQLIFRNMTNTGTEKGNERSIVVSLPDEKIQKEKNPDPEPEPTKEILKLENSQLDGTAATALKASEALQETLPDLLSMDSGTISFRYRLDTDDALVRTGQMISLLTLSNKDAANEYATFFISPANNKIGVEFRGKTAAVSVGSGFNFISNPDWQTISYTFDGEKMSVYMNGELVGSGVMSGLFSDIGWKANANTVTLGGAERFFNGAESLHWAFKGKIDTVNVDTAVLAAEEVKTLHQGTNRDVIGQKLGVWDKYDEDIFEYRIPSMVKTPQGTVVAASDGRKKHYNDWGDIATVVKTSQDDGKTWSENTVVLDMATQPYYTKEYSTADWNTNHTQSAFSIDPILMTDSQGKIYMLVDVFPESQGAINSQNGSGHQIIDGKSYLILSDFNKQTYTVREKGVVYDSQGNPTDMYVSEGEAATAYQTKGDLYQKEGETTTRLGNIYLRSGRDKTGITKEGSDTAPLFTQLTSFLWLLTSEDQGKTWSAPLDITGQVKEDWMGFIGTGAATGLEVTTTKKAGEEVDRLMFPIYYTNQKNASNTTLGRQSSANVYSDDGGLTWQRGESPNDGRIYGDGQQTSSQESNTEVTELTENQIVQLDNGHLLQFMRNTGTTVAIARSTDFGETWDDEVVASEIPEPYVNLSVTHMTINDKEYVVMSNPVGHPDGEDYRTRNSRMKGALRIGEVQADDSIKWVASDIFEPKRFAYSSLVQLDNQTVGMLYENNGHIKYSSFNVKEMLDKGQRFEVPTVLGMTTTIKKAAENSESVLQVNDQLLIDVNLSQTMMINGQRQLNLSIGGTDRQATYVSGSGSNHLTFQYKIQAADQGKITIAGQFAGSSLESKYGLPLVTSDKTYPGGSIGEAISEGEINLGTKALEVLKKGKSLATTPVVTPAGLAITWLVEKPEVASVDESGKVLGLTAGTTKVTAKLANGKEASFVLRVTK